MSWLPLGISAFENLMNLGLFGDAERRREALAREAMGIADSDRQWLADPATFEAGMPNVSFGGRQYGSPNGQSLNLDDILKTGTSYADSYTTNYGSKAPDWKAATDEGRNIFGGALDPNQIASDVKGLFTGQPDWQATSKKVGDILGGARLDSDQYAKQVGGYFPSDMSFRESQAADIGRIGAAGASRSQMDRNQMVSRALSSGKSLSDVQGDLDSYQLSADSQRALQAQEARAASESNRVKAGLDRAAAMTTASNTAAGINAALAQAGAGAETTLSGQQSGAATAAGQAAADEYGRGLSLESDRKRNLADYLATMTSGEEKAATDFATGVNRAEFEDTAKGETILDQLNKLVFQPRQQAAYKAADNIMGLDQSMAGILAGLPVGTPQMNFSDMMSFLAAKEASRQPKQNPFAFGIGAGPVSFGYG